MKVNITPINLNRIIKTYKSARKNLKNFLKAVLTMLGIAYRLNRKRFVMVLASSAGGVSFLGLSLGLLLKYVKHLESNTPVKYLGYSFEARDGFVLVFISLSVMVLLISSAGMLLWGKLKTKEIALDFSLSNLTGVAERFGWDPPDDIAWLNDRLLRTNIRTLYMQDSNKSANALRRIFEGFQQFLTVIGGIAMLLWLDAAATFFLLIIISISLIFYSKITTRATSSTRGYENTSGELARKSRALLDNVSTWPNPSYDPAVLRDLIHGGPIKDANNLYFDKFVTRSMSEFFSYVLTAVALSFLVVTLGYAAIEGKRSWAAIVGFILILRTVMQTLKTIFKIITEVYRVYPGISRLYEFHKNSNIPRSKEMLDKLNLVISNNSLHEKSEKQIVVQQGDIIGISAPVSLSRYSIKYFEKVLAGGKRKRKKGRADFISSISIAVPLSPPLAPVSLRNVLGIPPEMRAADLRNAAGTRAAKIEKTFLLDPDRLISAKDIKNLSPDSLNWLSLISCVISDKPILLIHSSLISEDWLREKKSILKNRILVVCFNDLPEAQISLKTDVKTYIVAAADGDIVAAGSFGMLKKRKADVKKTLREHDLMLISKSEKIIAIDDLDDDDEEDD